MKDFLFYNELYDLYKNLLTEKQRLYFEDYYFNNLSLSEMSENYNISRNAISKQLSAIRNHLRDYEDKLKLNNKKTILTSLINKIENEKLADQIRDVL